MTSYECHFVKKDMNCNEILFENQETYEYFICAPFYFINVSEKQLRDPKELATFVYYRE